MHKIVRLFVNALSADNKHYLLNREKLTQPIQMQLPQQQKRFYQLLFEFLKSILNFEHFQTKDEPHS